MTDSSGKLFLVPTPIGNLQDITARALDILRTADIIACEDTRTSGRLLKHYEISAHLISYHEYNERSRAGELAAMIKDGKQVAVITDAGSPGISDPAYRIVRAALDEGLAVEALPGPCAIIPALTASGLPTDRFFYEGFLPVKSGSRKNRLSVLSEFEHTLIFYESPHRLIKALTDMAEVLGDRQACVSREISKKFEEHIRGSLREILLSLADRTVKGEIVVTVAGKDRKKKVSE